MKDDKITVAVEERGAILKEWWNAEESGYCSGIRLDPQGRSEYMRTASSCCGVRA